MLSFGAYAARSGFQPAPAHDEAAAKRLAKGRTSPPQDQGAGTMKETAELIDCRV